MPTEFALLGDVEARTAGRPVDIGHTRQQLVLVALILQANRAVCIEELVERVWTDRAPLRARQVIYTYLSRLRKALATAEDVDISRRQGVRPFR